MNIIDIITKKKDNQELTTEEINYFVDSVVNNSIEDYQITSLLMAICINSMNERETVDLTNAYVNSGEVIDLSTIKNQTIDKHSTGGIGDKTSLIIGPVMACFDLTFAKLSGRGLGFTGGTLDKLESLEGFNINLDDNEFINQLKNINIALIGQTKNLVPADKKLYALRDVSGTVSSIPLIAASVMSKKLASGAENIILDVKYGEGAFMKDVTSARILANELVKIGRANNKKTIAIISNMNQPLGLEVGNANEIMEVVDTLKGKGPEDLRKLCMSICCEFLIMTNTYKNEKEAEDSIKEKISSGEAYSKFIELLNAQGSSEAAIYKLTKAQKSIEFRAESSGYLSKLHAVKIGNASVLMGAGRLKKSDNIDHSVSITLHKKIGDKVSIGEPIITLFYNDERSLDSAASLLTDAIEINSKYISKPDVIEEIIK